jgi:soluble lytic murein transglycosylase-like protein
MADQVLRWAGLARRAQQQTGVPASVLLGVIWHESRGIPGQTSSAGAQGITQFMPGTAASYHVDVSPGHEWSQILGTAHYLNDLGYARDPRAALAAYAGGPGNPQYGYADEVLAASRRYAGAGGTSASPAAATSSGTDTTPATGDTSTGLFGTTQRSGAVRALTYTALTVAGAALAALGIVRTSGLRGGAAT